MTETETDTQGGFSSLTTGTRRDASWAAKGTFAKAHELTLLGELEREEYEFAGDPDIPNIDNYGLVADYRFNQNNLTFTASARHDINDVFADATTWRVGAGYKFEWDGRLRGSIGTGVKNPTLIELFGFFPESRFTGNPDLQPETSLGFSVGYEQSFGDFDFAIDYFRSELEEEITGFANTVINLEEKSTREGFEIETNWQASDQLDLSASLSLLESEQNNIQEIRRPERLASATATYSPIEKLSMTVNIDFTGSQFDTDFGDCIFVPTFSCNTVELDAYTLVGANVRYQVSDILSIYVRGTNLLDEAYQDVVGFSTAGRGVFTGITANF